MNRLIPFALLVLLIGSSLGAFGVYEWNQNQQLTQEVASQKQQLDTTAEQLRQVEDEKRTLQAQLNETQTKVAELEMKTTQLQGQIDNMTQQIEKLREQLKLKNYITIGLTFLANMQYRMNLTRLSILVDYINEEHWAGTGIYFFMYHVVAESWVPLTYQCSGQPSWIDKAWKLYPQRDVPIIFSESRDLSDGCAWYDSQEDAIALDSYTAFRMFFIHDWNSSLVLLQPFMKRNLEPWAHILTHELLHVFSITDTQIDANPRSDSVIPVEWYARIQLRAKWFQMTPPSS